MWLRETLKKIMFLLNSSLYMGRKKKKKPTWSVYGYFCKPACYCACELEVTPKHKSGLTQIAALYQSDADRPVILKQLLELQSLESFPKNFPLTLLSHSLLITTRRVGYFISCQK